GGDGAQGARRRVPDRDAPVPVCVLGVSGATIRGRGRYPSGGSMQLTDLTWPDLAALSKETPIVFPVAALEQHRRPMPLLTDNLLLGEVVRRAADRLGDKVVFAPLQWLGNSDHHMDFPGTLSAAPRVYLDLLNGLLENFIAHGFRRLVIVNGHGGNDVPG